MLFFLRYMNVVNTYIRNTESIFVFEARNLSTHCYMIIVASRVLKDVTISNYDNWLKTSHLFVYLMNVEWECFPATYEFIWYIYKGILNLNSQAWTSQARNL